MVFQREMEGKEQASVEVVSGTGSSERRQRLGVVIRADEPTLVLTEGGTRLRSWPLHVVRLTADQPGGIITLEAGGETLTWSCSDEAGRKELSRCAAAALATDSGQAIDDAALGALLEDAAPDDADAEQWVKRLGERLARLDALNVGGMLAAATEGGGAQLAARLEAGASLGAALAGRLARYEAVTRGAAAVAGGGGAAEAGARALLKELQEIFQWLEPPPLADLDALPQISLATSEGRARVLAACEALRAALRAEPTMPPARRRLAAVRDRLRRLHRTKDQLCGAIARHLNNALIHLGNEAAAANTGSGVDMARRQQELLPYAPLLRWLRATDEKAYLALQKVYVGSWSRVYEREVRAACDAAKAQGADNNFDQVLTLVENLVNAEQDFCTQFFSLDIDVKSEYSDGERSEKSDPGDIVRKNSADTRRLMSALFPAVEGELVALVTHIEKQDQFGAMRALACAGRRALGGGGSGGGSGGGGGGAGEGEGRWARAVLAAVAVAAKRGADKLIADRIATFPDSIKQAARRQKCGILSFIEEFTELSASCEKIFANTSRRADLERWYLSLAGAMLAAIQGADHPRTPRHMIHTENYHALHGALSALRVAALESARKECKARYTEALRNYVTTYFGRPLEKLTLFFEGVAEAVAGGAREEEVCYRAAFSKHELRKVLAMYPAHEVRKSLHRLYKTVEKHVSEESGLLQVVWRAMQEEFLAQYVALQARIAACYPGAGLAMPLSTQDILDAFSDIAKGH